MSVSSNINTDYAETIGKVSTTAAGRSHNQPGDPDPPVPLPLGSDTVAAIERKHAQDAAILSEWRTVSFSTDFAVE